MSIQNYSVENLVVTVNGRRITSWGHGAEPFTHSPIDPHRHLVRGMGGRAIVTSRSNPGEEVTINLLPGSPCAKYLSSLDKMGAQITLTYTQIGTSEKAIGYEGVIVNIGSTSRAGVDTSVSDDQFIMQFNRWEGDKGGN